MACMTDTAGLTFNPNQRHEGPRKRGCFTCGYWGGSYYRGRMVCDRNRPWRHIPGQPEQGCAFWMRATGADDE
jgi:hypothetical protein